MDAQTENIIRNVAKRANEEIKQKRKDEPGRRSEDIAREVMAIHFKTIAALGVSRFWLSVMVGRLNGQLEEK